MDAGLISYRAGDYFEMQLAVDPASSVSNGAYFTASNISYYRDFFGSRQTGISLLISKDATTGWYLEAGVPSSGIAPYTSTVYGDLKARYIHKLYASGGTYYVSTASVEIWKSGALVKTFTLGDLFALKIFPSFIPLIGIPPELSASATPLLLGSPGANSVAQLKTTGGFRWENEGAFSTFTRIIPPPTYVGCGTSAPPIPVVTSTDSWNNEVNAYGFCNYDSGRALEQETIINSSRIIPIPDGLRRLKRMNRDYEALLIRATLPGATAEAFCACGTSATNIDWRITDYPIIPARDFFLDNVGYDPSAYEDALNDRPPCLYDIYAQHKFTSPRNTDITQHVRGSYLHGAGSPSSNYVPGLMSDSEVTRYWDFLCNPWWSHGSWWDDWEVNFTAIDLHAYWLKARSQHTKNDFLPPGKNTKRRNNVSFDAIESNINWWTVNVTRNMKMLGASRWQTYNVVPKTSHTLDSSASALFSYTNCTAALGANIVLTSTGPASFQFDIDMGTFGTDPRMWIHTINELMLDWVTTNISSIAWYFVGRDTTETLINATAGVWLAKPNGTTTKYAGSYGIDNGMGLISDTGTDVPANGISSTVMADNEANMAFGLAPDRTYTTLRCKITATNPLLSVTVKYPQFRWNYDTDPSEIWESGQVNTLFFKNGPCIRFGNDYWFDRLTGTLMSTPLVKGISQQNGLLDVLCDERVWLRGLAYDNGLSAQLTSLFDSIEGQSYAKCGFDTAAPMLPNPSISKVQYAVMNMNSEIPPLCLYMRKERDANWDETGVHCQDVWSRIIGYQRYVAPGVNTVDLYSGSTLWTNPVSGYVPGHRVTEHNHEMDNSEVLDLKCKGTKFALVNPAHGYHFVSNLSETTESQPFNLFYPPKFFGRVCIVASDVVYKHAYHFAPIGGFDFSTTVTSSADCSNPRLAYDSKLGELIVVYARATGNIYYRVSYDEGQTWSAETVAVTNVKYPHAYVANGIRLIAGFRYNSGTSGPGKFIATIQYPGDTSPSAEFTFKDGAGVDLEFEDDTFSFMFSESSQAVWVMSAKAKTETQISEYLSYDEGTSWVKL